VPIDLFQERTRSAYLTDLYDELLKMTLDSWCGVSGSPEKMATNIFDSFKKMALKKITEGNGYKKSSSVSSSDGQKTPTQVNYLLGFDFIYSSSLIIPCL